MDEYIKKQDVIDLIMSQPVDAHYPSWYVDLVSKIPAVDAVPAVRCKDCEYAVETCSSSLIRYCMFNHMPIRPDDFCSCAERKNEGAEIG